MKLIAHRGNLHGPTPGWENTPEYCKAALLEGYEVEIDTWYDEEEDLFYMGHDNAVDVFPVNVLTCKATWLHAKDIKTLKRIQDCKLWNYFFHQNDDVTLTNNNYLWTFPGCKLTEHSIAVVKDIDDLQWVCNYLNNNKRTLAGICSDFVGEDWFKRAINYED